MCSGTTTALWFAGNDFSMSQRGRIGDCIEVNTYLAL